MAWHAEPRAAAMSSTRAEIVGGITAAIAHGPMSIRTDSRGFRAMHRRVCAKFAGIKTRPYVTQPNGDLARVWMALMKKKGPAGLQVRWVKGHTDGKHAQWGLTDDQAEGNKEADEVAQHAIEKVEPIRGQFMRWAIKAHEAYVALGKEVDKLAVEILMRRTMQRRAGNDQGAPRQLRGRRSHPDRAQPWEL